MRTAKRLDDGSILVPSPAYDSPDIQGDGMRIVRPGEPLFDIWNAYLDD